MFGFSIVRSSELQNLKRHVFNLSKMAQSPVYVTECEATVLNAAEWQAFRTVAGIAKKFGYFRVMKWVAKTWADDRMAVSYIVEEDLFADMIGCIRGAFCCKYIKRPPQTEIMETKEAE